MTEDRSRRERLEARAAQIEAELAGRMTASGKAAERFLNPTGRSRGRGWQPLGVRIDEEDER